MAEKGSGSQHTAPRDNWFDLHGEENNSNDLNAKQWKTERRETDDESTIGNLHYGTETEKDLRKSASSPKELDGLNEEAGPETNTAKAVLRDRADLPSQLSEDSTEAQSSSLTDRTGSAPSAEALSSGGAVSNSTRSVEIERVDLKHAPDSRTAPPEATATETVSHQNRQATPENEPSLPQGMTSTNTSSTNTKDTATTSDPVPHTNEAAVITGSGASISEDREQAVSGQLSIVDPDAGEESFSAETIEGTYGSLEVAEDGSWSYSLNNTADNVQQLNQGDTVTDTITVTSADGTTHDLVMTVNGTNDAPIINTITEKVTSEDGALVNGTITATDVDADDSLTYSSQDVDGLTFNPDGTYSFDPGHASYQSMAAGESQTISVPVTAEDSHGATTSQNLTITLTGTNDTPIVSGAVTLPGGTEDTSQSFTTADLLANADDIDTNDTLSVANVSVDPDHGILTSNPDGTFTFTPRENYNGEVVLSYDVSDGIENVPTTASINLEAVNDAPVITDVNTINVTEDSMEGFSGYGATWEGDVYSVISQAEMLEHLGIQDVDSDSFTVSLADTDDAAWHGALQANDSIFTSDTLESGSALGDETVIQVTQEFLDNYPNVEAEVGDFYFDHVDFDKLSEGELADINFSVQVSDGETTSEPRDITIQVTGSNDAPTITNTSTVLLESFENFRDTNGWNIEHGTGEDNTVTGDHGAQWNLADQGLEIQRGNIGGSRASDGESHIELDTSANTSLSTTVTLTEGETYNLNFAYKPRPGREDSSDMNVSFGDKELSIQSDTNGNLTFTSSNGVQHQATEGNDGWYTISATFNDLSGEDAALTFTGTGASDSLGAYVDDIQLTQSGDDINIIREDSLTTVSGQLTIVDKDAGEEHFQAGTVEGTYGSLEVAEDGSWSYTLNNDADNIQHLNQGDTVTDTVTVTSADGTTHDLVMTVNGTNDAPIINTITEKATSEDGALVNGTITATDVDTEDSLTFSAEDVDGLSFNEDGSYSFDPSHASYQSMAAGETKTISIPVTSQDSHGATASQNLTITLTGTNDAPTVSGAVTLPGGTEDTSQSFTTADLLANADDIDSTDTLSVANISVDPAHGTLTSNSDGSFTFTPKADYNGNVDISYDVTDGVENVPTTASINLEAINDAPVITDVNTINVTEDSMEGFSGYGATWEGDVYSVVSQAEMLEHLGIQDMDSDSFTVSLADTDDAAWHGGLQANDSVFTSDTLESGSARGDETVIQVTQEFLDNYPNVEAEVGDFYFDHVDFDKLSEGEKADINFSVQVSDGNELSEPRDIHIEVTGSNDAVSLVADSDTGANIIQENATDGTEVNLTGLATDADGDAVTYTLVDEQGNTVTDGPFTIDPENGIVTLQDSSQIDYETQSSHTLHIQATSEDGTSSTNDFNIDIGDAEIIKTTDLGGDENGTTVTLTLTGDHYDPKNIQDVGTGSPQYHIRINGEILEVDGQDTFSVEANRGHIEDNHVIRDGNDVEQVTFKVPEGTDIDSVAIEFTNDAWDSTSDRDGDGITTEDRNLVVKELNIGGTVGDDGSIEGGTTLQAEDTDVSQYIASNGRDVSGRETMAWRGTMTFYPEGVPPEAPTITTVEPNLTASPFATDEPGEQISGAGENVIVTGLYAKDSGENLLENTPELQTSNEYREVGDHGYNYMGGHDFFKDNDINTSQIRGGIVTFSDGTTGIIDSASNGVARDRDGDGDIDYEESAYIYYKAFDSIEEENPKDISGEAEPNSTVELFDDGIKIGETTTDNNGHWTITANLSDGEHNLTSQVSDENGVTSALSDNTAVLAGPPDLAATSDSGQSQVDDLTNDQTVTLDGSGATAGETITIYDENNQEVGSGQVEEDGTWSVTTDALNEGEHNLSATVTDAQGVESTATESLQVTIDTTGPDAPEITSITETGATGFLTDDPGNRVDGAATGVTVTGLYAPDSSINLLDNKEELVTDNNYREVGADRGYNYMGGHDYFEDNGINTGQLRGGIITFSDGTTGIIDAASNGIERDRNEDGVINDEVVDGKSDYFENSYIYYKAYDGIEEAQPVEISGTAESDSTVEIFDGDTSLGVVQTDSNGNWSLPAVNLPEGEHSITATATDAAGNLSNASEASVQTINFNAEPVATDDVISADEDTTLTINADTLLANDSDNDGDTLSITAVSEDVTDSDGNVVGKAAQDDDGNIVFTPGSTLDTMAEGENQEVSFTYTISDGQGGTDTATATINVEGTDNDLTYVSETAGYRNVVGLYQTDEEGNPSSGTVVIDDQNGMVGGTHLADLEPGNHDFFIIANGAGEIEEDSTITFDTSGDKPVLLIDGQPAAHPVYFTEPGFNPDGADHFRFETDGEGGTYVKIEDLPNLGDADFGDVVLHTNFVMEDKTLTGTAIDGVIEGLEYNTTSGLHGFTDANGDFSYNAGDNVTFNVGGVTLGVATPEDLETGKTFLQDMADVDRTDLNDEYVENMATFLQSLDENSDAYDGIVITDATREALAGVSLDLRTASEEDVQQLVEQVGKEYVSEADAMEHVEDMLVEHTDLDHDDFDAHVDDEANDTLNPGNRRDSVLSSLPTDGGDMDASLTSESSAIEIKVPTINLDSTVDSNLENDNQTISQLEQSDQSPGNTTDSGNDTASQSTLATGSDGYNSEGMLTIGDILSDQLPSAGLTTENSGTETTPIQNNASAQESDQNRGNTANTGNETTESAAATEPDAEPEQAPAGEAATSSASSQTTTTSTAQPDNASASEPQEAEETVTVASKQEEDEPQENTEPVDEIDTVGETPSIAVEEEDTADDSASPSEEGNEELAQFDVSASASAPADNGDSGDSLEQFTVTDTDASAEEIPPMDGLDATPENEAPAEPEDAGLGADDAAMVEDVQEQAQVQEEMVAA